MLGNTLLDVLELSAVAITHLLVHFSATLVVLHGEDRCPCNWLPLLLRSPCGVE